MNAAAPLLFAASVLVAISSLTAEVALADTAEVTGASPETLAAAKEALSRTPGWGTLRGPAAREVLARA